MKSAVHADSYSASRFRRKPRSSRRGMVLVEAMMSLAILTTLGLLMLKLSLNILHPRQWILQQSLTDAYLTYERSYAERIPFEDLVGASSPWPTFPTTTTTAVEIGRLPGNTPINGTVTRTRVSGTAATNPAAIEVWKVQSVVTYSVGGNNYFKSRTVLRSQ